MSEGKKLEPVAPSNALKALDKFYVEARDRLSRNPDNFGFMALACVDTDFGSEVLNSRYCDPDMMENMMQSIIKSPEQLEILALALVNTVTGAYDTKAEDLP